MRALPRRSGAHSAADLTLLCASGAVQVGNKQRKLLQTMGAALPVR